MTAVAQSLITRLRQAGATLACDEHGNVRFTAATPIPAALLAEARKQRDAIASVLTCDAHRLPGARRDTDAWGFTPAERTAALARLRPKQSEAIPATPTADAAALDGYQVPAAMPPSPEPDTPERARFDARQAAMVSGLLRAARQRPPSWADPSALPSPGCFCSCCKGQRWWCELEAPKGWRCRTCHPPQHLLPDSVKEVRT